jgi:hypothetical protein
VLCLTGNIEKTVLFKNWVVFGEEFSFSLFEVRISKACHLDSGQCGAVGGTPLFNIGPFQVSVDRQRSEEVFDLVVARTTPINGRDGDMVFLYQLEKDRELRILRCASAGGFPFLSRRQASDWTYWER